MGHDSDPGVESRKKERCNLTRNMWFAAGAGAVGAAIILFAITGILVWWHFLICITVTLPLAFFFFVNLVENKNPGTMFFVALLFFVLLGLSIAFMNSLGSYIGMGCGIVMAVAYYFGLIMEEGEFEAGE